MKKTDYILHRITIVSSVQTGALVNCIEVLLSALAIGSNINFDTCYLLESLFPANDIGSPILHERFLLTVSNLKFVQIPSLDHGILEFDACLEEFQHLEPADEFDTLCLL